MDEMLGKLLRRASECEQWDRMRDLWNGGDDGDGVDVDGDIDHVVEGILSAERPLEAVIALSALLNGARTPDIFNIARGNGSPNRCVIAAVFGHHADGRERASRGKDVAQCETCGGAPVATFNCRHAYCAECLKELIPLINDELVPNNTGCARCYALGARIAMGI